MTQEQTDETRLKFLAENLDKGSVHIAIRADKGIVQIWTHQSKWVDMSVPAKFTLDDLRILIDEAMSSG